MIIVNEIYFSNLNWKYESNEMNLMLNEITFKHNKDLLNITVEIKLYNSPNWWLNDDWKNKSKYRNSIQNEYKFN